MIVYKQMRESSPDVRNVRNDNVLNTQSVLFPTTDQDNP